MLQLVLAQQLLCSRQVGLRLPGGIIDVIACPMYQVFQAIPAGSVLKDAGHLVLVFTLHLEHWLSRCHGFTRVWTEKGYVEYWVYLEMCR